jgi:hypothetical protein
MLDARENIFRLLQEDAPSVGQRDVLPITVEQFHADRFLELTYLLAQRRLRRANSGRRTREAKLFGDRDEVAQMSQFHCVLVLFRRLRAYNTSLAACPAAAGRPAFV